MKGECTEKRDRELCCVFFFSSRRRHTRCSRDWSSDVCSSDLVGAASGGIRHNRFNVGLLEGIHRLLGEVDGSSLFSRMHKQGPTASLRLWSDHLAALSSEDACRGGIDLREKYALHATEKQADAPAFRADGRRDFQNRFLRRKSWKQRLHRTPFIREQHDETESASQSLQAGFLIGEERRAQAIEAIRPGKRLEQEMAMTFLAGRPCEVSLDLRAGGLDQFAVVHARRARDRKSTRLNSSHGYISYA